MKNIFVAFFLLLTVVNLFSQSQVSILDLNGNDWVVWSVNQKKVWIAGFLTSHYSIMIAMDELDFTKEKPDWYNWLNLSDTLENIITAMDKFYNMDKKYLEYPIWNAIYIVFDREWWGKSSPTPEKTEPTPRQHPKPTPAVNKVESALS
jgi:hypothetical protein